MLGVQEAWQTAWKVAILNQKESTMSPFKPVPWILCQSINRLDGMQRTVYIFYGYATRFSRNCWTLIVSLNMKQLHL